MPNHQMRRLMRERRRIAAITGMTFFGLWFARAQAPAAPLKIALIALAFGLGAGLVSSMAGRLRAYCDAAGLAVLALAVLVRTLPGSAIDLGGPNGSLFTVLALGLGLLVLARGVRHGLWALPLPQLRNLRFQVRAGSPADIFSLWNGLVPASERIGLPAPAGRGARAGSGQPPHQDRPPHKGGGDPAPGPTPKILETEAPFHIRLSVDGGDGRGVIGSAGVSEIFLVELGPSRLVLLAHSFPEMPLGRALLTWLDDTPGRMLDGRLAVIEQRIADGEANAEGGSDWPTTDIWRAAGTSFADWEADAARDMPAAPANPVADRRAS